MIIPMKKIHVIVEDREVRPALDSLKRLGAVHVEHMESIGGHHLAHLREDVEMLKRAVETLKACKVRDKQEPCRDWRSVVEEIRRQTARIDGLNEDIAKRAILIHNWEPWGDFNIRDIEKLEAKGIYVTLFKAPAGKPVEFPSGFIYEVIFTADKKQHGVAVSRTREKIPYETVALPPQGLETMKTLQEREKNLIEEARTKIRGYSKHIDALTNELGKAEERLMLEEAAAGMKKEGRFAVLKGFCPRPQCGELEEKARTERWGLLLEDPSDEDNVPTLLKNPKWVDLIRPVLQFVDILPGYKEMDVSLVFLLFFSLFFGMLIGDAAYGAIFMALTFLAHKTIGKKLQDKAFFHLMYVLSGTTIIWGVLTGTFFGQAWVKGIIPPMIPWLTEMNNIILLCFIIAAVHLSIAHIWQVILLFPNPLFLAQVGWLFMVWTMFFAANMFVLNMAFPSFMVPVSLAGVVLILFFTKPNRNLLKALGPGLAGFLMNFINAFTDVVSYIRLFAVGLATVAVADAFNDMAVGVGFDNILVGLGAGLILVVGHVLNMVLAGLAVLVHGIRLNVLEFPGHLSLEWRGVSYKPLKRKQQTSMDQE